MIRKCKICTTDFIPLAHNIAKGFGDYCSRSCVAKDRTGNKNSNWRGGTKSAQCITCGKVFIPASRDKRRKNQTCSYACRGKSYAGSNNPNWQDGKRSGRRGYERDVIMGTKKYQEWRKAVVKRDSDTCQLCGIQSTEHMVAHHIMDFYDYPEERFNPKIGMTLCRSCHSKLSNVSTKSSEAIRETLPMSDEMVRTALKNAELGGTETTQPLS